MRIFKGSFLLIAASFSIVACASSPESSDPAGETSSALTGAGGNCSTDSNCRSSLVCDLHCPSIPGRAHCEIAGGTCNARAELTTRELVGLSFASTDGAHSIAFASGGTFTKLDGCPDTGIHCEHIQQTTGTYSSNGTTIRLHPTTGGSDTLSVDPHSYDGVFDNSDGVQLYPSH